MTRVPSILVVSPGGRHDTGGICRVVDDLAAAWARAGHVPPMRVLDSGGMRRGPGQLGPFVGSLLAVSGAALTGRAALLHVHVATGGSVIRKAAFVLAGRLLGISVVLHLHGADFERFVADRGPFGRMLIAATFRAADTVVALGSRARLHLMDALGVPGRRIALVPNGVTLAEPRPICSVYETTCRFVFVGALTERKGLDTLIDALATRRLAPVALTLDVIGNGDDTRWRARAGGLGVADRIRFHGWHDNDAIRRILGASDVLVLPSRAEALPIAVLEAMAEGVAVIASAVGEVADAVQHGETGLLVPAADPLSLADAMHALATDAERRHRLGRAGRQRAAARFDIDRVAERLAALFATVAERRRGRRPASGAVGVSPARHDAGVA